MCGIVGTIATSDKAHHYAREHFLRYALMMDTIRGKDSTGIINVQGTFGVTTNRTTMSGNALVSSKQYQKWITDGWATVGHNRAATAGSVKVSNAHPFSFGPITLVHNGTLHKGGLSLPTFDKKLEVDSMQIALALSLFEPGQAKNVLEEIDGGFALVWTDDRDKSVNMARNSQRPLHFSVNDSKSLMCFMSDGHMLTSILKSFGQDPARGGTVYSIDTMKHLKFKKGSLVPSVSRWTPYTRPVVAPKKPSGTTTNKAAGTGALPMSAAEAAKKKWSANRVVGGAGGLDKVKVNGKKQDIPKAMVDTLETFMELDTSDRLEFVPCDDWHISKHTRMVEGLVNLPHWGDTEWDALIMDVPMAECNAYWNDEWTVQPIGLTRPLDRETSNPALLCKLIRCSWEKPAPEPEVKADKEIIPLVKGIGGRFTTMASLKGQLQHNCINCGKELVVEKIALYEEVNAGSTDVLCEECVFARSNDV